MVAVAPEHVARRWISLGAERLGGGRRQAGRLTLQDKAPTAPVDQARGADLTARVGAGGHEVRSVALVQQPHVEHVPTLHRAHELDVVSRTTAAWRGGSARARGRAYDTLPAGAGAEPLPFWAETDGLAQADRNRRRSDQRQLFFEPLLVRRQESRGTRVHQSLQSEYSVVPNGLAAMGYDAMSVLANAMKSAKSLSGDDLRAAIAATKNFQAVTGVLTLDENRNPTKAAVVLKVDGGDFKYATTIKP